MTVFSKINKQFIPLGLLLFFVISLPLKNNINSISIILLTLYSIYFQVTYRSFNLKTFKKFTPFIVYFVVALLSVLYSENTSRAFRSVNKLLPFNNPLESTLSLPLHRYSNVVVCEFGRDIPSCGVEVARISLITSFPSIGFWLVCS